MHVSAAAKTDVGRVRERNEDAYLVQDGLGLYVVADGMGGHAGGARASRLTVQTLETYLTAHKGELEKAHEPEENDVSPPLARLLADALRAACATVYDAAARDPALAGMGTTCTALLVRGPWAYVAHVGDSRCYMQRGARFMQVTEDHSLVNEQVRAGLLAPEAAAKSKHKNIITRSVGFEREVEVDTFLVPLQEADQFLLCSDGLSNLVENNELGEAMLAMHGDALLDFVVNMALERGGDDNVTAVTLQLRPGEMPPPAVTGEWTPDALPAGDANQQTTDAELTALPHDEGADGATMGSASANDAATQPPENAPLSPPLPPGAGSGATGAGAAALPPPLPAQAQPPSGPSSDNAAQASGPAGPPHIDVATAATGEGPAPEPSARTKAASLGAAGDEMPVSQEGQGAVASKADAITDPSGRLEVAIEPTAALHAEGDASPRSDYDTDPAGAVPVETDPSRSVTDLTDPPRRVDNEAAPAAPHDKDTDPGPGRRRTGKSK